MLPRHSRLTRPEDFRRTIRSGVKAVTATVVVYLLVPGSDESASQARAGVTVSKAVSGSVGRHRVARQIRHALAGLLPEAPPGSLLVVRALPGAAEASSLTADVGMGVRRVLEAAKAGQG